MSFLHYQYSGIGGYTFLPARKAEFLRGGGLDGDVILVYSHHRGKRTLHFGNIGLQLRPLSADGSINITHQIAFSSYAFRRNKGFYAAYAA